MKDPGNEVEDSQGKTRMLRKQECKLSVTCLNKFLIFLDRVEKTENKKTNKDKEE